MKIYRNIKDNSMYLITNKEMDLSEYEIIELKDLFKTLESKRIEKYELNNDYELSIIVGENIRRNVNSFTFYEYYFRMINEMWRNTRFKFDHENMFIDYMYVVGLFNFDKIIYLKADEMPIIALYGSEFNVTNERIGPYIEEDISVIRTPIPMITYYHLLGCYVHADKEFIEEVKDKGYKEYREINVGDKLIVICRENIDRLNNEVKALSGKAIKEYFGLDDDEYRNTDKGQELVDFYGDYYQVLNKVFTHELGHAVFDCISNKSRIIKERQANYFTSVVYGGKIDKILNAYYNMVGSYYKEPLLLSHRYLMSDKEYDEKWSELI